MVFMGFVLKGEDKHGEQSKHSHAERETAEEQVKYYFMDKDEKVEQSEGSEAKDEGGRLLWLSKEPATRQEKREKRKNKKENQIRSMMYQHSGRMTQERKKKKEKAKRRKGKTLKKKREKSLMAGRLTR